MTVSKEIAETVRKLNELIKEADLIRIDLAEKLGAYFDGCIIEDYGIVDEPTGEQQDENEWCDQWTWYISDSGNGVYYYKIDGEDKYLAISYTF